jgi:hypothetical protein
VKITDTQEGDPLGPPGRLIDFLIAPGKAWIILFALLLGCSQVRVTVEIRRWKPDDDNS